MADPLIGEYEDRASFAGKFQNVGSLDQRRRRAQDLSEAQARHEERQAQEFENLQIQRPEVGRLMLGRSKEEQRTREARMKLGLEEQKFERQLSRDDKIDILNQQQLDLRRRSEDRMMRKEQLDLYRADKEEEDTLAFEEGELDLREKHGVGTPEYREGLLNLSVRLPFMNKSYRQDALKNVGYEDPDVAFRDAAERAKTTPGFRQTIRTPTGTMSVASPQKPTDELEKAKKENDRVRNLWDTAKRKGGDPSTIEYFEERVRESEKAVKALEEKAPAQGSQSTTEQAQTATSVRRKASDGSIWEFDPTTKQAIRKVE